VTNGSGPRPTAHHPQPGRGPRRPPDTVPQSHHRPRRNTPPQPPPATHKGTLKPGVPDGLTRPISDGPNPPIYSLVFYTVFEEAGAKVTGVARGGG